MLSAQLLAAKDLTGMEVSCCFRVWCLGFRLQAFKCSVQCSWKLKPAGSKGSAFCGCLFGTPPVKDAEAGTDRCMLNGGHHSPSRDYDYFLWGHGVLQFVYRLYTAVFLSRKTLGAASAQ